MKFLALHSDLLFDPDITECRPEGDDTLGAFYAESNDTLISVCLSDYNWHPTDDFRRQAPG